jgi:hypothetical protein
MEKNHQFRIFDFNVYNDKPSTSVGGELSSSSGSEKEDALPTNCFIVQMFGVNEAGKTCSILVENFQPFFYVLVDDKWNLQTKARFLEHVKSKVGAFHEKAITNCIMVNRKNYTVLMQENNTNS